MRYADAAHVRVEVLLARRPYVGRVFRWLGYGGIAAAVLLQRDYPQYLLPLLGGLVLLWLAAWWFVVGSLWRSSLVAACLLTAIFITYQRLTPVQQVITVLHAPAAQGGRA